MFFAKSFSACDTFGTIIRYNKLEFSGILCIALYTKAECAEED